MRVCIQKSHKFGDIPPKPTNPAITKTAQTATMKRTGCGKQRMGQGIQSCMICWEPKVPRNYLATTFTNITCDILRSLVMGTQTAASQCLALNSKWRRLNVWDMSRCRYVQDCASSRRFVVCCWMSQQHARVWYLRHGSAETIAHANILRHKLQITCFLA